MREMSQTEKCMYHGKMFTVKITGLVIFFFSLSHIIRYIVERFNF